MIKPVGIVALVALLGVTACSAPNPGLGPDGRPLPQVYRINAGQTNDIQFRMLDSVNALRAASGLVTESHATTERAATQAIAPRNDRIIRRPFLSVTNGAGDHK